MCISSPDTVQLGGRSQGTARQECISLKHMVNEVINFVTFFIAEIMKKNIYDLKKKVLFD